MFTGFVAIFIFPTVKDGIISQPAGLFNHQCIWKIWKICLFHSTLFHSDHFEQSAFTESILCQTHHIFRNWINPCSSCRKCEKASLLFRKQNSISAYIHRIVRFCLIPFYILQISKSSFFNTGV